MSAPRPPARPLERARGRAVDALTGLYADDELTVEELEERLDRCYRAESLDELETVFSDLPAGPELRVARPGEGRSRTGPAVEDPGDGGRDGAEDVPGTGRRERPSGRAGPPAERPGHDLVLGVMSGVRRSGRWTPPRHMNAVAVMGGIELDFRDARFPPGETTLNAVAFWGAVEITVPPGLRVECSGVPLMGGFDRVDQDGDEGVHPGAVLRVRGVACMGGVEVTVKAPGES